MDHTTLPIGEAVTLLMFFRLKSIKDVWDLPSGNIKHGDKNSNELDAFSPLFFYSFFFWGITH